MPLVIVGVLLLVARFAEFGPFATMSWWWVALPFGLAVVWWQWSDASGWTKKRAMNRMEDRKRERREKQMEALGISSHRERVMTRAQRLKAQDVSSDPTHAGRGAPSKPKSADPTARD